MKVGRLGIGDDHDALHDSARRWVERHCPPAVPRAYLDGGAADQPLPPFWDAAVEMGWPTLGADYGLPELGVVLEELGRACAPGPFLPVAATAAALARLGAPADAVGGRLAVLATATPPGALGAGDRVSGRWDSVPGAESAELLVLPVDGRRLAVVDASAVTIARRTPVDETRPLADVEAGGAPALLVLDDPDGVADLVAVRAWAAEAVGGATWCVEAAASHAAVREQFGRPIGQFQGVKHRCADLLCQLELARAAVWDALRCDAGGDEERLVVAAALALAPEAYAFCAKGCVQVLGGIGFTWEHDAHLHLKRAIAGRALLGGASRWRREVAALARGGARRQLAVDLPESADAVREEVRDFAADLATHPKEEWRARLADGGWIAPHWPSPWGRDAGPVEQLVIDEELANARIRRPHLQVGAWVLPTLIAHGTEAQQARFVGPTMRGELTWCQLFSEPGAGSDLASLSTKAVAMDGGWSLTGQKVWTTMANTSDYGLCLARTGGDRHEGITCFVVDMASDGLDIRPLRELTGQAMFNEVFLSDVFVPDDLVVGEVGHGWAAARTTLANERVSMGTGSSFGLGVELLIGLAPEDDVIATDEVGQLLAQSQALAVLGLRMAARAVSGAEPGSESSVRKLLGVEHEQRVQEVGLELLGRAGAVDDGDAAAWVYGFLANRCLTIAGGTSEIQRNVIAERLLGLPKDP